MSWGLFPLCLIPTISGSGRYATARRRVLTSDVADTQRRNSSGYEMKENEDYVQYG